MAPGILGKKVGMTQVYRPDGRVVPVTVLKVGPCVVVQRKSAASDGYDAVQLGLVEFVKPARINRSRASSTSSSIRRAWGVRRISRRHFDRR